jgi:hypothetical protein
MKIFYVILVFPGSSMNCGFFMNVLGNFDRNLDTFNKRNYRNGWFSLFKDKNFDFLHRNYKSFIKIKTF